MYPFSIDPSIIITMGPSTFDDDVLTDMFLHNVSWVRFNMSHADLDEHRMRLHKVREIAKKVGKTVRVFVDLAGPKIRVTKIHGENMHLSYGKEVSIVQDEASVTENSFTISFHDLYNYVREGTVIALDDGKIKLSVLTVSNKIIICKVTEEGVLINEKGVNIIDVDIPISPFTERDKEHALFALKEGFDAIALSFVKRKEDIISLRDFLSAHSDKKLPIIAKIETRQALHSFTSIMEAVDMVMVARGDLGIEIPVEKIPLAQKELLYLSTRRNIPVIVATEMLKSMTKNAFPTRAEITDCATALIDGASYLMLSDETTIGEYPKEAVRVMASVIEEFSHHRTMYGRWRKA